MTETPDSRGGRRNMTTQPDVLASTGKRPSMPTQRTAVRPDQASADAVAARLLTARSSRFALTADLNSPSGAQKTGGMLLRTLFFRGCADTRAEVTVSRALTCLAELAGSAAARQPHGSTLWCQIWMDDEHVFVAVEEDIAPAFTAPERVLHSAHVLTDDCGSTELPDGFQTWAAIRRLA